MLDFKLGKSVPPVTGSPIRDSVLTNMRQTIGKQRANETIKVWDAVARGANPRNPGQWYLENIAEVQADAGGAVRPGGRGALPADGGGPARDGQPRAGDGLVLPLASGC